MGGSSDGSTCHLLVRGTFFPFGGTRQRESAHSRADPEGRCIRCGPVIRLVHSHGVQPPVGPLEPDGETPCLVSHLGPDITEHSDREVPRKEPDVPVQFTGNLQGAFLRRPKRPAKLVRRTTPANLSSFGPRKRTVVESAMDVFGLTPRIVEIDDVVTA